MCFKKRKIDFRRFYDLKLVLIGTLLISGKSRKLSPTRKRLRRFCFHRDVAPVEFYRSGNWAVNETQRYRSSAAGFERAIHNLADFWGKIGPNRRYVSASELWFLFLFFSVMYLRRFEPCSWYLASWLWMVPICMQHLLQWMLCVCWWWRPLCASAGLMLLFH